MRKDMNSPEKNVIFVIINAIMVLETRFKLTLTLSGTLLAKHKNM